MRSRPRSPYKASFPRLQAWAFLGGLVAVERIRRPVWEALCGTMSRRLPATIMLVAMVSIFRLTGSLRSLMAMAFDSSLSFLSTLMTEGSSPHRSSTALDIFAWDLCTSMVFHMFTSRLISNSTSSWSFSGKREKQSFHQRRRRDGRVYDRLERPAQRGEGDEAPPRVCASKSD